MGLADTVTPELVLATAGIPDALAYAFDFELLPRPMEPDTFTVMGPRCRVLAVDATGGAYAECSARAEAPLFAYVDRRGRYGVLARSFAELLRLIIELPYWRELLERATGDALGELRRLAVELEEEVRSELPFFEAARIDLLASLPLPAMPDPVAHLHAHARQRLTVVAADGTACDPLGGRQRKPG